jgi:hypothetical protein
MFTETAAKAFGADIFKCVLNFSLILHLENCFSFQLVEK